MLDRKGLLAQLLEYEPEQKAALPEVAKRLKPMLETVLSEFYTRVARDPELNAVLIKGPGLERLKKAQIEHWGVLLAGNLSDDLRERARRIGDAHVRVGLTPRFYIAAYTFLLERFLGVLLGPKHSSLPLVTGLMRAALIDMELALSAYLQGNETETLRREASQLNQVVKGETDYSKRAVSDVMTTLEGTVKTLSEAVDEVEKGAKIVERASEQASSATQSVAAAIEELHASSQEVGGRAAEVSRLAGTAVEKSNGAAVSMARLSETAAQVSQISKLIDGIAKQTNLLALNATIEAARAGEAGKGFAVVASEVKVLSQRSANAAREISQHIAGVQQAVGAARSVMDEISGIVNEMSTAAVAVSGNVSHQVDALKELGTSAHVAATATGEQGAVVGVFAGAVTNARQGAETIKLQSAQIAETFERTSNRMAITILSFTDIETRRNPRMPVQMAVRITVGDREYGGVTRDLSLGGSQIDVGELKLPEGAEFIVDLPGIGAIRARCESQHPLGMRVSFRVDRGAAYDRLRQKLDELHRQEEKLVEQLISCRDMIQNAMTQGLEGGRISIENLFDTDYKIIPGTNPRQVRTKNLEFLEGVLPVIIEPVLLHNSSISFCVAVDFNGYLPVHNAKFSKPQGSDPVWNAVNSRNRRVFDDNTGLLAARNKKPFLTQTYPRDMGDGKFEFMMDISAPIMIQGRHWGATRMAVVLPNVSA